MFLNLKVSALNFLRYLHNNNFILYLPRKINLLLIKKQKLCWLSQTHLKTLRVSMMISHRGRLILSWCGASVTARQAQLL